MGRDVLSNECLEYLGDAVLRLCVADELYTAHATGREGPYVQAVTGYVNGAALAAIARRMGLGAYLHLGGSMSQEGRDKDSILEDALEALIGAVYLDRGMDAARGFVYTHIMGV